MAKRRTWWGNPALRQAILTGKWGWWLSGSQLDLDFAHDRAFNRSTGFNGSPNGILTYTSPSPKMVYGDDGVLGYAPHNLLLQSQTFDNASWTKGGATITANAVAAPDGTTTADKLVEDATLASHFAFQTTESSVTSGVTYTQTVYAKAAERTWLRVFLGANIGNGLAWINLSTGAVGTTSGSPTVVVTDVGNGWYRIAVSKAATGTGATSISFLMGTSDGGDPYTGNGTSGVYLWGAQLNLGSSALTYVPTTTAAAYSLPIDHDPVTHAQLGVLIEEQRTNLILRSQDFSASWSLLRVTASTNAIAAPDGTVTADQLLDTAVAGTHVAIQTIAKAASSIVYDASVYVKANVRDKGELRVSDQAGNGVRIAFNLTTATITAGPSAFGAGFTVGTASITSVGNGWYRVELSATSNTAILLGHEVYVANASDATSYTGDGSGFYVWGAQLEAGAFASSYIPTVASQVTRAADQVSILTSAFGYNETAGSLLAEVRASDLSVSRRIAVLYNDASNRIALNLDNGSQLFVRTAGSTVASVDGGTFTVGQDDKVAVAFTTDDYAATVDGAAVGTDTAGTMPSGITVLQIGHQAGIEQTSSHIKRLTYFPTRKSNAELQALTA